MIGQISTVTNDTTPTIRITVTEIGAVQVSDSTWIEVTAADVSRGYKEVDLSLSPGDYTYDGFARAHDADGFMSARKSFSFAVDTVPPDQPTVLKVLDNVGPTVGEVPNGGTTDDNTPTLQISLPYGVKAGDPAFTREDAAARDAAQEASRTKSSRRSWASCSWVCGAIRSETS